MGMFRAPVHRKGCPKASMASSSRQVTVPVPARLKSPRISCALTADPGSRTDRADRAPRDAEPACSGAPSPPMDTVPGGLPGALLPTLPPPETGTSPRRRNSLSKRSTVRGWKPEKAMGTAMGWRLDVLAGVSPRLENAMADRSSSADRSPSGHGSDGSKNASFGQLPPRLSPIPLKEPSGESRPGKASASTASRMASI